MFIRIGVGVFAILVLAGIAWIGWPAIQEAVVAPEEYQQANSAQLSGNPEPDLVGRQESQGTSSARLSGPYTHDNLSICLIHGTDSFQGQNFLMLHEALAQGKFVIHETHKVNELTMENLADSEVIILSGDILKGGQQDRIAQYDQIVPAKSGKLPLVVFCVEHTASRWGQPMTEKDRTFTFSPGRICSKNLRLASRYYGDQSAVWADVERAQNKLSAKTNVNVKARESDSSLALSLKAKEVQRAAEKYIDGLAGFLDGKPDVVGFAFAVNGRVVSSDVYGSPTIFRKVWRRLLQASAIEAFAELPDDRKFQAASAAAFQTFLLKANEGKHARHDAARGLEQTSNEAGCYFKTVDPARPDRMLRALGSDW